jgi:hypothetical protein
VKQTTIDRAQAARGECEPRATRDVRDVELRRGYQEEAARQSAQPPRDNVVGGYTIVISPDEATARRQNRETRERAERRGIVLPDHFGR